MLQSYSGKLGELRSGSNNFSFRTYDELEIPTLSALFAEADRIFHSAPRECMQAHGGTTAVRANQ